MAGDLLKKLRHDAKKMVAKGKTYGKKKGRDLASVFLDLSISPSKPGTNAITRALAPTPDSQDEGLLRRISAPAEREQGAGETADGDGGAESESGGEEQAVESADLDEDKENRPRGKARACKQVEEQTEKKQVSPEISELTSLPFVKEEVADFQKFCKGWEKEFSLTKIGQGSYATVLKMELRSAPGRYSVWKLMPLKPSTGIGSRPRHNQTLIKDAATEVRMLYAMSDMDGFVQFRSAYVVQGHVPEQIRKAHEPWAKTLRPDDTWYGTDLRAEFPSKFQLWLLMEMTDAGQDLDFTLGTTRLQSTFFSIHETLDIFCGVAEALMRGEAEAQFEHRDLHPGNICIKQRDKPLKVTSKHGVPRLSKHEVTLIDYTQSRLTLDSGDVLATAIDEPIFRQVDPDPAAQRQYDMYRLMRDAVKKEKKPESTTSQMWNEYVPTTNVLWLYYILTELMMLTRMKSRTQEESDMFESVQRLGLGMWSETAKRWEYGSACEVVSVFLNVV